MKRLLIYWFLKIHKKTCKKELRNETIKNKINKNTNKRETIKNCGDLQSFDF